MPNPITIGTDGLGTSSYQLACALAPLMEQAFGVRVRATPMESNTDKFSRQFTVTFSTMANSAAAQGGEIMWADEKYGPQALMQIWHGNIEVRAINTRADADPKLKTVYDIKGLKLTEGMHSSACIDMDKAVLAFANLKREDVTMVPCGSWAAMRQALMQGQADVTYASTNDALQWEAASAPHGIRALALPAKDLEAWSRFLKQYPWAIPGPITTGPEVEKGVESFFTNGGFYVYPDVNPQFNYRFAKFLYESFSQYKDLMGQTSLDIGPDNIRASFLNVSPCPVAPGADAYFKEKGIWKATDDKWVADMLSLEKQYADAFAAAVKEGKSRNLKISASDKEWNALWDSYRTKLPRFAVRLGS